ncbi:competence protein ComK [Bacillus safensis]
MSGISETPLDSYVINQTTMAVLSVEEGKRVYSKVIERETSFYVELKPLQIIERSCRFFGSSYAGRKAGTYEVTGISHKPPIVIDSSNHLYFFPTYSSNRPQCGWISHKYIHTFQESSLGDTVVTFTNEQTIKLDVSYKSFESQVHRTAYLRTKFQDRLDVGLPKKQEFMLYPKEQQLNLVYDFILRELRNRY